MKYKYIIKKLREAGFTFSEGGNHTKAYDEHGMYRTAIPRHSEVSDLTAKRIEKQTGVTLF